MRKELQNAGFPSSPKHHIERREIKFWKTPHQPKFNLGFDHYFPSPNSYYGWNPNVCGLRFDLLNFSQVAKCYFLIQYVIAKVHIWLNCHGVVCSPVWPKFPPIHPRQCDFANKACAPSVRGGLLERSLWGQFTHPRESLHHHPGTPWIHTC